jgi:hypothetical protein
MLKDGRTGRQTDMTKLIVAFRKFAIAPNNVFSIELDMIQVVTFYMQQYQ